jgi:transcriptional regulator with XRE-family HTH domain
MTEFGQILRELRTKKGLGIKRLAPDLGVNYTYLSKLENGDLTPSEEVIGRVAKYFNYNNDRLLLAAGKIPPEILKILRENPDRAVEFLRERFGGRRDARGKS